MGDSNHFLYISTNRKSLVKVVNQINGNNPTDAAEGFSASNPEGREILINWYATALAKGLSRGLDVYISPFLYHSHPDDDRFHFKDEFLRLILLEGGNNFITKNRYYTKHYGIGVAESEIIIEDNMIKSNKIRFCESSQSGERTYSIIKSISNTFAEAANLDLIDKFNNPNAEKFLDYKNNLLLDRK